MFLIPSSFAWAMQVMNIEFQGKKYTWAQVDLAQDDLRLFLSSTESSKGQPKGAHRFFNSLARDLNDQGLELIFAMNAGMYMKNDMPLGLYIENFSQKRPLNLRSGNGNFYLKPNGVFLIDERRQPLVVESTALDVTKIKIKWATQSGPLLILNKKIHSEFRENSKNLLIRNAVGVDAENKIHFVISRDAVNFYEFAELFQKKLNSDNALYLDGNVSQIYSTQLKRYDRFVELGPMFGVVKTKN